MESKLSELEQDPNPENREELSEEEIAIAKDMPWGDEDDPLAKENRIQRMVDDCKADRTKKNMTPKQLANLRQNSMKSHSPDAKDMSLRNLRKPAKPLDEDPPIEPTATLEQEEEALAAHQLKTVIDFPEFIQDPDRIREILTIQEQRYFVRRWAHYMNEHSGDFNWAEDYDSLIELILNYIHQFRLIKKMKNAPTLGFDKAFDTVVHNVHLRIRNLKNELKTRRRDRLDSKDNKQSLLFEVIKARAGENKQLGDAIDRRLTLELQAENELLAQKRIRDPKVFDEDGELRVDADH